jgi:hypothetical protein
MRVSGRTATVSAYSLKVIKTEGALGTVFKTAKAGGHVC